MFFQAAALFDLTLLMLRCFTTRPTSCCLVFSTSDLGFLIVWSCLGDATLLDLDYLTLCCLMSPNQVVLFDLVCMVLGCLISSASCCRLISPASSYAAWSFPNHVMLLDLVFIMPRCLIVSTSCYAAEPSLPYVMFLGDLAAPCLMLCCLILSSRLYASWSFLPHATFLTFLCYVACASMYCWVFLSGLHSCCYAAWPSLPLVRLLGLPYLMWCCLCALYHTVLFGLVLLVLRCMIPYVKLRCLAFPNWCYAA